MLKSYELLYIVHPDLEGTTDKVMEKIAGFIKKADGEIISQEDWGKRKLAYKIAKNDFGVYVLVQFQAESTKLQEIERSLRLSEEVMRSMVVSLPEVKEVERPKKKEVASKEKITAKKGTEILAKAVAVKEKTEKTEKTKTEVKATPAKKAKKAEKPKVEKAADEKERMKKLDEKLEELLK